MIASVRTTLILDDDLADALKKQADRSGRPFKDLVNETLRAGLEATLVRPPARRYRVRPAHLGGVRAGIDLDGALRLAASLEEEDLARKLEQRK